MSCRIVFRVALPALLMGTLLPLGFGQSQDTQSVAEAARRAKEQKKAAAKPARVFTDDDVKPATPTGGANPTAPATAAVPASGAKAGPADASTDGEKAKEPKEVSDLRGQLKQALSELDLLQRQLRLDQDTVYSKTDYASDKAGIAKVDAEKQQVSDKQQEVDTLKAKLADLLQSLGIDASAQTPPQKPL